MGAVILAPACGLALAALPRGGAFSIPAQRCHVYELPHCTRKPAPNRHAGRIPYLPQFVSPSRAFRLGQVAVALEHKVSDAPAVDLGDHAREGYCSNLYR